MADIALIHGAWHGGWCWDAVAAALAARGHRVLAPTLAGMAERQAELHRGLGLVAQAEDAAAAILAAGLSEVTLVAHSYGGMVATLIADRLRRRIRRLVYLDAMVPVAGERVADYTGPRAAAAREQAEAHGDGWLVPPLLTVAQLGLDPTDPETARVVARLTPQPLLCLTEPAPLVLPPIADRTYVYCSVQPLGIFERFRNVARGDPAGWAYFELATGHDCMLTMPATVGGLIDDLASRP